MESIPINLECPLCHSRVEVRIRERGYYGHTSDRDSIPKDAVISAQRKLTSGKTRYHYRFKGYIPMCSNKACFLYGITKMFRSLEEAEKAWIERARSW